ncbi:MAG: histidine phosphatase family protein [Clostridia bacterium]|nr:histidine phosphatase family protein [Clostridia bacterium]
MRKWIYFIRHGESVANANNVCCGQGNPPLTEKGKKQAADARVLLRNIKFDTVFCSDLTRAVQTEQIMLNAHNCRYIADVREINAGSIDGQKRTDLMKIYGEDYAHARTVHDFSLWQGESAKEFVGRAEKFLQFLEKENVGERVAVFCHAGFIQRAAQLIMGNPYGDILFNIDNCSVTIFSCKDGKWRVYSINRTPEMP